MTRQSMLAVFRKAPVLFLLLVNTILLRAEPADTTKPKHPAVGEQAPDFELRSIDEKKLKLSSLTKEGTVVVVVLRGYPGYQCPLCTKQVSELLRSADKFKKSEASVILVYPGPAEELKKHAEEFARGKKMPGNFHLLLDPDYQFTAAYGLRWNALGETAYPSTFVIGADDKVRFAKVSSSHGDRASVTEILKAVEKK